MQPSSIQQMNNVVPGPRAIGQAGDRSIGAMLIDSGKITPADAETILHYARERSLRFGDAAVALRLASEADVQEMLARQFDYSYLQPGQSNVSSEVIAAWQPFSEKVENLRALRSQLLLRWFTEDGDRRLLSVVGVARGEGRSHVSANLAVVFSQMGERTLLVDADLRNARQHEVFGLPNAAGLSTILAQRAGMEVIQRVPGFVDLSVLTAGPTPPNPSELLGRPAFADLCDSFASQFDVVIFDTSAAILGSEYQLVSKRTRGVVVVARRNHTQVSACRALADELRSATATVVGSVLNEF